MKLLNRAIESLKTPCETIFFVTGVYYNFEEIIITLKFGPFNLHSGTNGPLITRSEGTNVEKLDTITAAARPKAPN